MTRYRVDSTPQAPGSRITKDVFGTVTTTSYPKPPSRQRIMYDEVIPDFRKRSAAGEIFNNSLTSSSTSFDANDSYSGSTVTLTGSNAGKSNSTQWVNGALLTNLSSGFSFPNVPLDTSAASAKAAISAIASVNATEVDLMNFAVEWNQTRSLHRQLGHGLLKLFTEGAKVKVIPARSKRTPLFDLQGNPILNRKGKPKYIYSHTPAKVIGRGKSQRTKNAADLYLAGKFGVLPLLDDLEGAMKVLFKKSAERYTARGTEILNAASETQSLVGDYADTSHVVRLRRDRTFKVRYGILYESPAAVRMAAQLGLLRPLSSTWESLPWSFVGDWFVDVGSWLDAIQPSGASRTLCAWVSTEEVTLDMAMVNSSVSASPTGQSFSASWSGSLIKKSVVKTRQPWTPVVPTRPSLGTGLNSNRSASFAALILQRISTKLR